MPGNTPTPTQDVQQDLQDAQVELRRLEAARGAARRDLETALAQADGQALHAIKRQLAELDDLIRVATLRVARCELAALDSAIAEHRTQAAALDNGPAMHDARAAWEAARDALKAAEQRQREIAWQGQVRRQQGEDLQRQRTAAQLRLAALEDTLFVH